MTKTNVPKLRFKGFSGEWKNDILENNVNFVQGNDGTDTSLPVLTISAGKGWMNQKDRFGTVLAGNELKNYTLLKKGQLSYNHGNSKLAEYGAVFCLRNYDKALVPRVYHSFELKNGDSNFIEKLFESKIPDRQLRKLITSGARMDGLLNINKKAFGSISLNFPSQYEQQKIGSFFTRMDKIIELQIQKLEQLKKLKQAYLQKIFAQNGESLPRLRFSGFSGEWEECKIKDIIGYRRGSFPQPYGNKEWYDKNGYKFAQVVDINDNMHMNMDTKLHISKKAAQKSVLAKVGTILITIQGSIGRIAITEYDTFVDRTILVIDKYYRDIDKYFLMTLLFKLFDLKKKEAPGSTIKTITKKELSEFNVLIPTFSEQQRIGLFLRQLDEIINNQSNKIEILKQQKKAYLQKIFI